MQIVTIGVRLIPPSYVKPYVRRAPAWPPRLRSMNAMPRKQFGHASAEMARRYQRRRDRFRVNLTKTAGLWLLLPAISLLPTRRWSI